MTTETITCSKCGHENPASAYACMKCSDRLRISEAITCTQCGTQNPVGTMKCSKCGGDLRMVGQPEKVQAQPSKVTPQRKQSDPGMTIAGMGLLGVVGTAVWLVLTFQDYSEYRELSAVQVTQLYTQAGFWVLVSIGVLLAGILWVASTRE